MARFERQADPGRILPEAERRRGGERRQRCGRTSRRSPFARPEPGDVGPSDDSQSAWSRDRRRRLSNTRSKKRAGPRRIRCPFVVFGTVETLASIEIAPLRQQERLGSNAHAPRLEGDCRPSNGSRGHNHVGD
jgi:hypothetical protein